MITAHVAESERVEGLDAGADDYLVKPFGADELMARIRAVFRRTTAGPSRRTRYVHGNLELDDETQKVTVGGEPVPLSRREYEILRMLLERPGDVVTRDELARSLWGLPANKARKSIDVHMTWLRRKLGDASRRPKLIETVRASGFRLIGEDEATTRRGRRSRPTLRASGDRD
jgi:DNA-binding response OmpR family regulator